jgi:ABC-type nickel/cobalt efflux system permease component RcnA
MLAKRMGTADIGGMDSGLLLSIVSAGLALAFFHAAIPTHWLPFVVTARAQGWSKKKTLTITAFAGAGHIALTAVLGVLVIWFGIAVDHWTGNVFPWIAGGILIAFGLYYLVNQFRGHGHHHHHHHHARPHSLSAAHVHSDGVVHAHPHEGAHAHCDATDDVGVARVSDAAAITSLFVLLTFSPCEAFIPIYVSAAAFGWTGFALSTAVLAVGAITGMVVFTWLTMSGLDRFHLHKLERFEGAILGTVLCVLGAAFILFEA